MVHHCARGNIPPSSTNQDLAHRLVMQSARARLAPFHAIAETRRNLGAGGASSGHAPLGGALGAYLEIRRRQRRRRTPRVSRESVPIVAVSSSDRRAKAAGLEGTHCRDSRWVCTLGFVFLGEGHPRTAD
ncbi:hypothetical protein HPB48_002269 [Haemaphysalis longicornis]|uniref:Uncharacterized protein n=1 Tax=Haemaphysalis longicornis TaxID=44386 RepID=A0A9J6FH89_HAELO|nr:hypothetical protein HPB48_002269 [Haemaphysalis longicornis]